MSDYEAKAVMRKNDRIAELESALRGIRVYLYELTKSAPTDHTKAVLAFADAALGEPSTTSNEPKGE